MKKELELGAYYKIEINDKTIYKYPIYVKYVGPLMDGVYKEYDMYEEILTGLHLYSGCKHPALKDRALLYAWHYHPYKTPERMVESVKEMANDIKKNEKVDGLFFDLCCSKISKVTAEEIKKFYTSMDEKWHSNIKLSEYLYMFDQAIENQERIIDEILKEKTKMLRFYHYHADIYEYSNLEPERFVKKLLKEDY